MKFFLLLLRTNIVRFLLAVGLCLTFSVALMGNAGAAQATAQAHQMHYRFTFLFTVEPNGSGGGCKLYNQGLLAKLNFQVCISENQYQTIIPDAYLAPDSGYTGSWWSSCTFDLSLWRVINGQLQNEITDDSGLNCLATLQNGRSDHYVGIGLQATGGWTYATSLEVETMSTGGHNFDGGTSPNQIA
jgi:hypothetical protein